MIPEWATHIAVDANGEVWAFEGEPVWDKSPATWNPVDDFDGLRSTLIPLTEDVAAILCARIPRPVGDGARQSERRTLMATHDLKVCPEYFSALQDGTKTFEVRRNDRDFAVGDRLHLREWVPEGRNRLLISGYTGRFVDRTVSYVLHGDGSSGIRDGFCVLGLLSYVGAYNG